MTTFREIDAFDVLHAKRAWPWVTFHGDRVAFASATHILTRGLAGPGPSFPLPPGRTAFGPAGRQSVKLGLRRFAGEESGELEEIPPGAWRSLEIPPDAAPERWRGVINAPLRVCLNP